MSRPQTVRCRRAIRRDALRLIHQRLADNQLDLTTIAAEVGVPPRQLQRAFSGADETFREVLLRARMERARSLLERERNPLPASRVAGLVGYSKPSGLRQAFQRYWSLNPSDVQSEAPDELYSEVRDNV
jgi:AraC-like DNA-binding protein